MHPATVLKSFTFEFFYLFYCTYTRSIEICTHESVFDIVLRKENQINNRKGMYNVKN